MAELIRGRGDVDRREGWTMCGQRGAFNGRAGWDSSAVTSGAQYRGQILREAITLCGQENKDW